MKIEKMIYQSRVTEVGAATSRMVSAYKSSGLDTDTNLSSLFGTLEANNELLILAIRRSAAESNLEVKDEDRDHPLRGVFYLVQGFLHHPEVTIQQAAETINKILQKYGMETVRESYATESSLVNSLLKDLSTAEAQAAIPLLPGLAELASQLQVAQAEFEQARIAYEAEKANDGTQVSATELKTQVVRLINSNLVVYLRAMMLVNEPTHGEFGRTVAEIIADNNEIVRKRSNRVDQEEIA